jgi:hypothetical protein
MAGLQRKRHALACLLVVAGCGLPAVNPQEGCDGLLPGDFVITEVQANPQGADGDGEYIELYNASESLQWLGGATLVVSRADGTSSKAHRFADPSAIEPGDYFVAGNAAAEHLPSHLDYSYGSSLGNLRNADASVSLWCGERLIDEMHYERTDDGRALELDGRLQPSHELNDQAENWCIASQGAGERSTGNFGTPGSANGHCEPPLANGSCRVGESLRAIVRPQPGQVRITEWMANPAGPDAELEWVEVTFQVDGDLNGLQLGPAPDSLTTLVDDQACFPIDAGTRVVFGGSPAAAPRVDAQLDFSLGNTGARSIVAGNGSSILDTVSYERTSEGVAWQVDPNTNVCLSPAAEYRIGNSGTPGEPNPECQAAPGPGQCSDGGMVRDTLSPALGQVHITEWMADPKAVGNREGEWVELRLEEAVDLNGLVLTDRAANTTELQNDECLRFSAGTHIVLARSVDPFVNGGIEGVVGELSISLNNSDETITLSLDGQVLDSVSYQRSQPGVATQIDDLGDLCHAAQAYGEGDLGTPGAPNPPCF